MLRRINCCRQALLMKRRNVDIHKKILLVKKVCMVIVFTYMPLLPYSLENCVERKKSNAVDERRLNSPRAILPH